MRALVAACLMFAGSRACDAQSAGAPSSFPRNPAPREMIRVSIVGNLELRSATTKLEEALRDAAKNETPVLIAMKPQDSSLPVLAELVRVLVTTNAKVIVVVDGSSDTQVDPACLVLASLADVGLLEPESTLSGKPRKDLDGTEIAQLEEMLTRIAGKCDQKELARALVMRAGDTTEVAVTTAEGVSLKAGTLLPMCSAREGNEKRYLNAQQRPRIVRRYEITAGMEEARDEVVNHLATADQVADDMEKALDLPDPGKRGIAPSRYREAGAQATRLAEVARASLAQAEELLRANPELERAAPPGEPRISNEKSYRSAWESRLRQTSKRVQKLEEKSREFAAVPQ